MFSKELNFSLYRNSSFACYQNNNSRYYAYNRSGGVLILIDLGQQFSLEVYEFFKNAIPTSSAQQLIMELLGYFTYLPASSMFLLECRLSCNCVELEFVDIKFSQAFYTLKGYSAQICSAFVIVIGGVNLAI